MTNDTYGENKIYQIDHNYHHDGDDRKNECQQQSLAPHLPDLNHLPTTFKN